MYQVFSRLGPRGRAALVMAVGGMLAIPFLRSRSPESNEASSLRSDKWLDNFQTIPTATSVAQFDPLPTDFPLPVRPSVPPSWVENKSTALMELAGRASSSTRADDTQKERLLPMQPLRPWINGPALPQPLHGESTVPPSSEALSLNAPPTSASQTHSPASHYHSPWERDSTTGARPENLAALAPSTLSSPISSSEPLAQSLGSERTWPDEKPSAADFTSLFVRQPSRELASPIDNTARLSPPIRETLPPIREASQRQVAAPQPAPRTHVGLPADQPNLPTPPSQSNREKHYIYQPKRSVRTP